MIWEVGNGIHRLRARQLQSLALYVLFGEVCVKKKNWLGLYMLWFKFIFGLKFFELVSILFAIVPDYGNEYTTKENKN